MFSESHKNHVTSWVLFFLLAFTSISGNCFFHATRASNFIIEKYTIESEDGDAINCVDIYKQPAFSHPLLKNHTIQMRSSSYPKGLKATKNTDFLQDWDKHGKCPEGTIPIARTHLFKHTKASPVLSNRTQTFSPPGHAYAIVYKEGDTYYGPHANLSVWNPLTFDGEFSLAQIWVLAGHDQDFNSIEAGWQVVSGDNKPRIFIYWTRDNYRSTGCYNLDCHGFVQTSSIIALGSALRPVSTYGGKQYHIEITIHKDKKSGNWWLQIQGQELGYWPASILTSLAEGSTMISWGGEIVNSQVHGHHTSTQMGSGHFSAEGFSKAGLIFDLGYVDNSGVLKDPEYLVPYTTNPSSYDMQLGRGEYGLGVHYYFGGPGFLVQCP